MARRRLAVLAALTSALTLGGTHAMAAERDKPNPWLDCGIGAAIFPDENLEVGAGISNVIWDLGTTAVTSAQSSPDTCSGLDNVKSVMFIHETYESIAADIARGSGEHIEALAGLHGCAANAALFATELRSDFAAIVGSGLTREEKAYRLHLSAAELAQEEASGACTPSS